MGQTVHLFSIYISMVLSQVGMKTLAAKHLREQRVLSLPLLKFLIILVALASSIIVLRFTRLNDNLRINTATRVVRKLGR